jgi:hypothetical protein
VRKSLPAPVNPPNEERRWQRNLHACSSPVFFPELTQLDLAGPFEVFHRLPDAVVRLLAVTPEPVESEGGLAIVPTITFNELPYAEVLFMPGGPGGPRTGDEVTALFFATGSAARFAGLICRGARTRRERRVYRSSAAFSGEIREGARRCDLSPLNDDATPNRVTPPRSVSNP